MSANGRLTPAELTAVGNGQYLSNGTAAAFFRMSAAAKADTGSSLTVSKGGGYRDLVAQQYLIDHPQGPVPIAPLGYSTHGDGRAADFVNASSMYMWLKKRASAFEFYQQFSSEPWHWRYTGAETSGGGTPIIVKKRMNTMYLKYDTNGAGYLFTDNGSTVLTSQEWELFKRLKRANEEGDFANPHSDPFLAGEMLLISNAIRRTVPRMVAGGSVDLGPVESAVKGVSGQVASLDAKVSAISIPPTTADIAKAVNDDASERLKN